jgi:hypothetical protein
MNCTQTKQSAASRFEREERRVSIGAGVGEAGRASTNISPGISRISARDFALARPRIGRSTVRRFGRRPLRPVHAVAQPAQVDAQPRVKRGAAVGCRALIWLAEVAALYSCWHVGDWVWAAVGLS